MDIIYPVLVMIGEGNDNPLQYSCLENPMGYSPWGHKELDMTGQLHFVMIWGPSETESLSLWLPNHCSPDLWFCYKWCRSLLHVPMLARGKKGHLLHSASSRGLLLVRMWLPLGAARLIMQRRQWHPTPVLLPGKSHRQRSLLGCSPWGR